mmetsp:Transcript_30175/g.43099  ORF Transcript_30175/g.43099 Transcript_30175/m.43099 type:complete len:966 (+) Transcript_30175:45-2942(+)
MKIQPKSPYNVDGLKSSFSLSRRSTFLSLIILILAIICGVVVFYAVQYYVLIPYTDSFHSETIQIQNSLDIGLNNNYLASQSLSQNFAVHCPKASIWPNCSLPLRLYSNLATPLLSMGLLRDMALIPLLHPPVNVGGFEAFAREFYSRNNYHHNDIGFMNFSIFSEHLNGTKYVDTTGQTKFSTRKILTPVFEIVDEGSISSIMYNMHSEYYRGMAIDTIIDAWEAGDRNRSAVTPLLQLIQDKYIRPASQMVFPIAPAEDPNVLVGFIRSIHNWDDVIERAVPTNANGIDIVIFDGIGKVTYAVFNGKSVRYLGHGDLCDPQYESFRYEFKPPSLSGYELYTFTICPRKEFFSSELLFAPISSCIFTVLLIIFVAALLGIHNYNLQRQLRLKQEILDSKQSFVRFISHEIRTPLNAVCMGLKLLIEEVEAALSVVDSEENLSRTHHSFGYSRASFSQNFPMSAGNEENDLLKARKRLSIGDNVPSMDSKKHLKNSDIFVTAASAKVNGQHQQSSNKKDSVEAEKVASWMSVMKEIDDSSNNAVSVLNELLIYDKIEMNAVHMQREIHPVWELLNSSVQPFNIQAREKGLRIEINWEMDGNSRNEFDMAESPESQREELKDLNVIGDADQLAQVFKNIVSNALKFSLPGATLRITAMWCPSRLLAEGVSNIVQCVGGDSYLQAAGSIRIDFEDEGSGISKKNLDKLFREGMQFNNNRMQAAGGRGLGLFTAKGIVSQHNGLINAYSAGLHRGSTFTVELPVVVREKARQPSRMSSIVSTSSALAAAITAVSKSLEMEHYHNFEPLPPSLPQAQSSTMESLMSKKSSETTPKKVLMNVLVVDDAMSNRKMLCRLLKNCGCVCHEAEDGKECVDWMALSVSNKAPEVDLVLMDYEMPFMKGPEAAKVLRERGHKGLIIGITGNVLQDDVEHFISCGANSVLSKPLHMQRLKDLLKGFKWDVLGHTAL